MNLARYMRTGYSKMGTVLKNYIGGTGVGGYNNGKYQ